MDSKSVLMSIGGGSVTDSDRPTGDFYQTPVEATVSLLYVEKFNPVIWEPACGAGAISEVLKQFGYRVFSTDLYDRGYGSPEWDFLTSDIPPNVKDIITNPPFNKGIEFAQKGIEVIRKTEGKLALLHRLTWLESIKRKEFFETSPLKTVWIFSRRIPRMHRPDYKGKSIAPIIAFAWYVWDAFYKGPPTIGWIDWKDYTKLEIP